MQQENFLNSTKQEVIIVLGIKPFTKTLLLIAVVIFMTSATILPCMADEYYNDDTGYYMIIEDEADLLSSDEEDMLFGIMEELTEYGHIALITVDYNPYHDTETYCNVLYDDYFGHESGTLFMIDMYQRYIYLLNDGYNKRVITNAYSLTITDNVYQYASDEDYFTCAYEAFDQVSTLLHGGRISQPMKYICNALLSLIIGFIITYVIVKIVHKNKVAHQEDVLNSIFAKTRIRNPQYTFVHQTRRYSPQSSGSSGGGGGGGGGGGRSGGGHSF